MAVACWSVRFMVGYSRERAQDCCSQNRVSRRLVTSAGSGAAAACGRFSPTVGREPWRGPKSVSAWGALGSRPPEDAGEVKLATGFEVNALDRLKVEPNSLLSRRTNHVARAP